ncbi:MAG: hypothetical protein F9K09_00430 [Flavobacteriales bacterium]|nr:MAG: hypothetical protein F9K09_00430 [Flavobacteriales bacterium]
METKKCMYCLKEFDTEEKNKKYCSLECETKSNNISKKNNKKEASNGFFQTITDIISSLFL